METKALFFLVIIFFIVGPFSTVFAQSSDSSICQQKIDTLTNQTYYYNVDTVAKLRDPKNTLLKEISKLVKVSDVAKKQGISGVKIIVFYLIAENGDVFGTRFLRGEEQIANKEEIIQIIENKKYTPAMCNNEKVISNGLFSLQLCFKY
ncbi:hypothetical protein [Flammeovirga sp. SJP92]|uniref:hypothetical protein n=1 Tax=Flammeovirga sp. SJP92 TaxID=1775430 RepID=UPI000787E74E|nr:hypothetical protein [Flammeovirga sp. SJP92]KXX71139.1 hypothetical protein AVL50_09920 [Flammeovirga sp. SJP92]